MSGSNGVIRVGRKGKKKFAFGEDGAPFEVDVVVAFQAWMTIDESFREYSDDRTVKMADMESYHVTAVQFVKSLIGDPGADITTAEALDFLARLREQYDEVASFFRPRSRDEQGSPATSTQEMRFSEEPAAN